ncbi:MAG TPA: dipeptidase [Anaerolineae bacterium]|jgi:acetylornithine deacetylase/succinyl-diaminopimelate desuccinylase-like protein
MTTPIIAFAQSMRERYLNDLYEYLAIPSVSAQPEHHGDIRQAAEWLRAHLSAIGLQAQVMETGGHPVVYAEWKHPSPGKPTVLIYGHYDVQPAEPFELWHSEPFKATVRDGYIYARGSSDNKGQHLAHVKAVEAYLKSAGELPVNVKFLIEGEEEIGGPNLGAFITAHKDLLACDVVMISDSQLLAPDQPTLLYGLRGLLYFEVEARCAAHDLHSGTYGGNVQNPAMALAQILAQLKNSRGVITVPGFYQDVRMLENDERAAIGRIPINEDKIKSETGATEVFGEPEFNVAERMGARPTLEVNGIWGGYTGAGAKTVLPAVAHAKISCRLVPYQDPAKIYEDVTATMKRLAPRGTELQFKLLQEGTAGTLIDRQSPQMQAAAQVAEATYGKPPIFTLEGGSIPVVNDFQRVLGRPIVLLGFGLPGDSLHAPDEHFAIRCYEKGIEASIRFLGAL